MKLDFSLNIFGKETTHISNLMKIRPVGVEVFHADGWIGVTKLTVVFLNFANARKKSHNCNADYTVTISHHS